MSEPEPYIGRFAPSPTGPLHFGSLLAAVASYLEARRHGGQWLVRMEDIDPPREQPGASDLIVQALDAYGFEWDAPITYQSSSDDLHHIGLQSLIDDAMAYACGCSRRDLAHAPRSPLGIIYPGTCRDGSNAAETSVRVMTDDNPIEFDDGLQGPQSQRLQSESGDFIILRRDKLIAYHLAVVVDDFHQGITDIVRGIDLMDSTPRQIYLQRLLNYPTPRYSHIPVAVHPDGSKLSKLTGAAALPLDGAAAMLVGALSALGQQPPPEIARDTVASIWQWALHNWDMSVLRNSKAVSGDVKSMAGDKNPLR